MKVFNFLLGDIQNIKFDTKNLKISVIQDYFFKNNDKRK